MTRPRAKLATGFFALATLSLGALAAHAQSVVATRPILAQTVIALGDVRLDARAASGALTSLDAVVGKEAKSTIYAGRPITAGDLRSPALIERNDIIVMTYAQGPLAISTEGRALDRGAAGDRIRVMNLSSRAIVSGVVTNNAGVTVTR